MEPITWVTIITTGAVVLIGVGLYLWGKASEGTGTTITVGSNTSEADCAAACKQLDDRRVERCAAKVAEAAAKTELDARRTDYNTALATWISLTVAAAAAWALPFPANVIVFAALAALATIALGVMLFMLGKLNAASDSWTMASAALTLANSRFLEARSIVIAKCPEGVNSPCISIPDPC